MLRPASPVVLSWTNQRGQRFETDIAVDNDYMFTVTQKIANPGNGAVAVRPYGLVSRNGVSKDPYSWTNRVGPIVKLADHPVDFIKAKDLDAAGTTGVRYSTQGGWLGFSDRQCNPGR